MAQREYISRRTPAPYSTGQGSTYRPRTNRKQAGPPPIIPIAGILLLIVLIIIIVLAVKGCSGGEGRGDEVSEVSSSGVSSGVSDVSAESPEPSEVVSSEPEPTPPAETVPDADPEQLGSLLQIGDTGYEYYNFVTDIANQYITTISEGAEKLDGIATVYEMVIPTAMDIMLPESYIEEHGINTSPQRKAIEEYIYPSITAMNPDVKTIPVFDALKMHCDEYIYFRTDHHWTQLGAYYAYVEFCKVRGFEPTPIEDFEVKSYEGFLGSFYSDTQSSAMAANPDTVEAYISGANTSLNYTTSQGETITNWPVIQDGTDYSPQYLYLIFAAGDQPYEQITNNDITDGSSAVVIKESFGNALIPFLADHYQNLYIIDYRYYSGTASQLAQEKGATDVIVLNNISMTRSQPRVDEMSEIF